MTQVKSAIVAGAGTGKTTRIIGLMVQALVDREIDPTRLLALTFTVKAANEMRDRLASKLEEIKAHGPLSMIDRMEIGTIHSFAAHILRQFPVEAGVSPHFREDEGAAAEELFRERWPLWLRDRAPDFLDRVEPDQLEEFARQLCVEGAPLSVYPAPEWKKVLREETKFLEGLIGKYEGFDQAHNNRCMDAARFMLDVFAGKGDRRRTLPLEKASKPKAKKTVSFGGWAAEEWDRFEEARNLAWAALDTDNRLMQHILDWLRPFVEGFREEYARRGYVSLHGLLVRSAELLRTNAEIRRHFKDRFRLVLVDEFQDTDPLQGEILLYLSERRGAFAGDWRDVEVEPGKLVIVGDPKQSIYLFRGADLDAYLAISRKLTGGDDRNVERLTTNYRSRREIIEFVNAACAPIMTVPPYEPIQPSAERGGGGRVEAITFADLKADDARRAEASAIADWILRENLDWGEVAILLRAMSNASFYTEALRERGIDFAIEGEKSFWQVPEVIDFLNLLTAAAHPTHEQAVAGLLRSPLGGVTDGELLRLRRAGALCPLDAGMVPPELGHVRRLYSVLTELHLESRRIRTAELVRRALESLPLREVWSASHRGEQAVANIEKLAAEISGIEARTLDAALWEARRRSRDLEEEGESPLADEQLDAVRILSIHKAKGLEFPVVVLADLHRQTGGAKRGYGPVLREWLSGRVGLQVGSVQNEDRYPAEKARREREEHERRRLLYVALTRAKDRLLLTGGRAKDDNYLGLLLGTPGLREIAPPDRQPSIPPKEAEAEPDPGEERRRWAEREAEARRIAETEPIRRPSVSAEDVRLEDRWEGDDAESAAGRELGTLCHDLLAKIDLSAPPEIDGEAGEILNPFFRSDLFREIASAERVYRETPFVIEIDGEVWSGQLDLLYKTGDRWIVADYKTDKQEDPSKYLRQKQVYTELARRVLELPAPPEFRLIYLRSARSVAVDGN